MKEKIATLITHRRHSPFAKEIDKLGNKGEIRALRPKLRSIKNQVNVHKCTNKGEIRALRSKLRPTKN